MGACNTHPTYLLKDGLQDVGFAVRSEQPDRVPLDQHAIRQARQPPLQRFLQNRHPGRQRRSGIPSEQQSRSRSVPTLPFGPPERSQPARRAVGLSVAPRPHQPARLAHVRLAIPRRTLPVEPPQVPVLAARTHRDHEFRHAARGFPDGFGGVGLHHQGPGLAGRGRPASEWSYVSPPFDHPKLTRHNGGSMDRLPDVMVDDHKLAGRCFQDADGDLGPRARRLPNPIGRTASCRPRRSSPSRGRAQPWLRASRPPPRGARPE